MRNLLNTFIVALCASGVLAANQGGDVNKILADLRQALGGEKKLAGVKTLAVSGRSTRVVDDATSPPSDFEIAIELPDKYVKKETLAMMPGMTITRTSGFNGEALIEAIDRPPQAGGPMVVIRGPGDTPPGMTLTPEQQQKQRAAALLANRQDFARLTVGLLAGSPAVFPVQFSYSGVAESPDGKADVIDLKGDGEFAARLFVDSRSHLPLMLSWMAREPLVITSMWGRRAGAPSPGTVVMGPEHQGRGQITPEQVEEMQRQAEADRKPVEYRLYYSDYQDVDGIKLPFHVQRSIAGKPVEELTFEKVKINGRIDPKKFDPK